MAPSLHKCILIAAVLTSMLLHTTCADDTREESSQVEEREPSMSEVPNGVKDAYEASLHQEGAGNCDCRENSSKPKHSDGQRLQNGNASNHKEDQKTHSGSHRYNGSEDPSKRNGTFDREGHTNNEWQRSHNVTPSTNETDHHGKKADHHGNKTHHHENATQHHKGESFPGDGSKGGKHGSKGGKHGSKGGKHAGGDGRSVCDCGRHGTQSEHDHEGMGDESHITAGSDGVNGELYIGEANKMEYTDNLKTRTSSSSSSGTDNHNTDNLKTRTSSSSSKSGDDEKGFGNAAVLGLAGAGVVAFCVASALLCVCFRRSAKTPGATGAVVGKPLHNMPANPEVVTGVVVNDV